MSYKFRCWDNKNKVWFFKGEEIWSLEPEIRTVRDGKRNEKDFILMLNTNIKDKNGKEIYFGDVIKYDFFDKDEPDMNEYGVIAEIIETINGGVGIFSDGVVNDIWEDDAMWTVEIIGNVWENPELSLSDPVK